MNKIFKTNIDSTDYVKVLIECGSSAISNIFEVINGRYQIVKHFELRDSVASKLSNNNLLEEVVGEEFDKIKNDIELHAVEFINIDKIIPDLDVEYVSQIGGCGYLVGFNKNIGVFDSKFLLIPRTNRFNVAVGAEGVDLLKILFIARDIKKNLKLNDDFLFITNDIFALIKEVDDAIYVGIFSMSQKDEKEIVSMKLIHAGKINEAEGLSEVRQGEEGHGIIIDFLNERFQEVIVRKEENNQ
ncbi:MAG: hypothetical protein R3Y64_09635 [Peptostreptococcaceae bacterium]